GRRTAVLSRQRWATPSACATPALSGKNAFRKRSTTTRRTASGVVRCHTREGTSTTRTGGYRVQRLTPTTDQYQAIQTFARTTSGAARCTAGPGAGEARPPGQSAETPQG